jgi:chromosomal replication initiator protein
MAEQLKKWEKTLDILSSNLSGVSFETWFLTLKFLKADETTKQVYLKPENDFYRSTIENRYFHLLEEAVREAYGKEYSVNLQSFDGDLNAFPNSMLGGNFNDEYYLNPRYNFSSFVVGGHNKHAHAVAVAIAEAPSDTTYNPFFIYGGSGLGKTHLMHAIGHYILQHSPHLKVLYVSSEMFTNEFIKAISERKMPDFKNKYRKVDVLLIDDIQFIEGKNETQEEFYHTFNTLYDDRKQIIISSDRAPGYIKNIDDRLRGRFQWNMIADISLPDYETRVAILRKKAEFENIVIDEDVKEVIEFIADKIKINIRELEGAFIRVFSFSKLMEEKIDMRFAKNILKDVLSSSDLTVTPESIKKSVCKHFNVKVSDIESSKKTKNISYPRQVAMYICKELTDLSLNNIGEFFGSRHHTTILYAYEKISEEIKENETLKGIIENIQKELTGN